MECSLKSLVPIWMLVLLIHFTQAQSTPSITETVSNSAPEPTNDITAAATTAVSVNTEHNNSTASSILTPTVVSTTNETVIPPDYVIKSVNGEPCLLATFNMTFRVPYYVTAAKSKRKYVAFKDIPVPELQDSFTSVCGENESSLILEWGNSTFSLNMTFMSHGKSEESKHTNWTLDSIAFGYNLSNFIVFPGSSTDDYKEVEAHDLELFNTVIGHTKECDKPMDIKLAKGEMGPVVKFEYVKLAAFNLTSESFPEETEECLMKTNAFRDEDIMVPLIIACALSFVIIVVVVAYAISRKVQEARDQSQYKPMP